MIRVTRTAQPDGSFIEEVEDSQSSIELERSATKGTYTWKIKGYSSLQSLSDTAKHLVQVDGELREYFKGRMQGE